MNKNGFSIKNWHYLCLDVQLLLFIIIAQAEKKRPIRKSGKKI